MRRYGRSKLGVDTTAAGRAARTYRGRIYGSKAEMAYAQRLDLEVNAGTVRWWIRQPGFDLGEDTRYHADFLVLRDEGEDQLTVEVVDVKGYETDEFKRVKRLWQKYGPCDLLVVKRGKTTDVVTGKGQDA